MTKPTKHSRVLAENKVIARRHRDLGFAPSEPMSKELLIELKGKGYRLDEVDDRKRFSKRKTLYGHYTSYAPIRHLPKKQLVERDRLRELEHEES